MLKSKEGGRRKEEGGRRKEEGGRRKRSNVHVKPCSLLCF
jgi:hypothetical protein